MRSAKYSDKDFTGWDMSSREDMSNIIIENSCFSHEIPGSTVFPVGMVGTTFIDCNLDNCLVPIGNTVIRGSQKRFECQNDLNDWLVDENCSPTMPVDHLIFEKMGLPIPCPEDIPEDPVCDRIDLLKLAGEI